MPNSRAEEEPTHEESGNAIPTESTDEQDQDGPATNRKETFRQHVEDAMDEHYLPSRLAAQ